MVPVVSVVGRSNSGKTTLLEKLIPELVRRGCRVGTLKHDVHGFVLDAPGKDTWRHAKAGAQAVAISSPGKVAVMRDVQGEMSIDDVVKLMGDVDIVITEGYKSGDKPKVEVLGFKDPRPLCQPEDNLVALVGDGDNGFDGVPFINRNDPVALADLLFELFLGEPVRPLDNS